MDVTLTAGIIGAAAAVGGAVVGAVITGIGETRRTKESRLFDRRVRQLDEVAALADAIGAMSSSPVSGDQTFARDPHSWEAGHLAVLSMEMLGLIAKADRYRCDDEVRDALIRLDRYRDEGSMEVAEGHRLIRQSETDPSVDLSEVIPFSLWLAALQKEARNCVEVAKKCLGEDEPVRWRPWAAAGLVVLLVVAVVLVVVL